MKVAVTAWLMCVLALAPAVVAAATSEPVRHSIDERNLELTRAEAPGAVEDYLQAEALLRDGKLREAQALLAKATAAAPRSPLLARRHCEVLTELGERARAVAKCREAISNIGWPTAMDYRAAVAAFMSGDDAATPDELVIAVKSANAARRLVGQPFADAAFCEIGRRLGDDVMLKRCIQNLLSAAPEHQETKRWAKLHRARTTWPLWLGWGVVLLAGIGTMLHALRAKLAARRAAGVAVTALMTCLLPVTAQAQALPDKVPVGEALPPGAKDEDYKWQLSQFRINHENPEGTIPSIAARNSHPLEFGYFLQDLASEAAYAERKNDDAKAVKYWRALAKAVPDSASGFSKACHAYHRLKQRDLALEFCSKALGLPGVSLDDYATFGELMTSKPGKPSQLDIDDTVAVIKHLRSTPAGIMLAERLECQLGLQLEDEKRLQACTTALAKVAPKDAETLVFQWSLAMLRKDIGQAERVLKDLKKSTATPAAIAQMEASTKKAGAFWRRFSYDWRYQLGLVVALLGAGLVFVRRRRANAPPQVATPPAPPSASADVDQAASTAG